MMAANTEEVKTVKEIFETMSYGNVKEQLNVAVAWLRKTVINLPKTSEEIQSTIQNSEKQLKPWGNITADTKAKLFNKLANEIENNTTLICHMELLLRQVLSKDTKSKSIKLLTDYIRYYAGWNYVLETEFLDYKPHGICVVYLSDSTPLGILGAILAPALMAGNALIIAVTPLMLHITNILIELCKNVGFPDGLISIVDVSNIDVLLANESIKKLTLIGNLYNKTIQDIHIPNEKYLTSLHLGKSATIVFDSADVDSAIDCIVQSAWGYKGMFPSGINQVYVQETIMSEFVRKIKTKILKLNIEYSTELDEKSADFIIPNKTDEDNIKVEYVNKIPLQIGEKTFGNNILTENENSIILSILGFRTANEAVALSNNSKFGLSISIWTENISLANEVVSKLQRSIIWVNNHGQISANIAFSPIKESGQGYFGGKEGILEYLTYSNSTDFEPITLKTNTDSHLRSIIKSKQILYYGGLFKKSESGLMDNSEFPNRKDVRNCVEIAKKSYEIWSKFEIKVRKQHLLKLADASESLKLKNTALVEKWIKCLRNWAVLYDSVDSLFQKGNPELKIAKEPLGIIAMNIYKDNNFTCLNYIIASLIVGNAIIIVNFADDMEEFLLEVCKIIPSSGITAGIFNVIFNPNEDVINTISTHREIKIYFNSCKKQVMFKQLLNTNYFNVNFNSFDVLKNVASNKCVLTSVGESFL